jgi:hypothetical protein
MSTWIPLTPSQVELLCDILDHEQVQLLCEANVWYGQFVPGIRFDLRRKLSVSENQLHQLKKLAATTRQTWRLLV